MTAISPEREPAGVDVSALTETLRGSVLQPDSDGYEAARGVWNLVYEGRPAAIAQVGDTDDVRAAVRFAREAGLEIAVRGAGHSFAGHSTGDGVLVIDMRGLRDLTVDPQTRIVSAGAGLTSGDVTNELTKHGLTIPFGDTASVGIAGLTLGGGIGYLVRKFGLTIDHVRSMEVVTVDGEVVTASAEEHPDLFWALRGGGGNFGIVTRIDFDAVPLGETLTGALILPLSADVLRGVLSLADAAPEELTIIAELMPAPEAPFIPADAVGTPCVFVMLVYAGDPAGGSTLIDELRALATPIADLIEAGPYPRIYEFSAEFENPLPADSRSMFAAELDDEAIERIVARIGAPDAAAMTVTQIRVLGGAAGRVPAEATAFAHRSAKIMFTIYAILADPDRADADVAWLEAYFDAMAGAATGVYVNFLHVEGDARVREAYPEATYRRLAQVKADWDPDNVLRRNQNIRPA